MRQLKITKSITNRESASLDKYLQEIGKEDLITADMEVILAQKIKAGDQAALEKLTKANLRFVVSVAKQYQNQGLSLPDLINEGNLGLIKAAQRFDETRGFKFISYAVWWIRQSILQALAEQSRIVRLPLNQVGSLNKINKAFSALEQKFEREPSAEELSEVLEIPEEKISDTMRVTKLVTYGVVVLWLSRFMIQRFAGFCFFQKWSNVLFTLFIDLDLIFKISKIGYACFVMFRCPSFPNLVQHFELSDFQNLRFGQTNISKTYVHTCSCISQVFLFIQINK